MKQRYATGILAILFVLLAGCSSMPMTGYTIGTTCSEESLASIVYGQTRTEELTALFGEPSMVAGTGADSFWHYDFSTVDVFKKVRSGSNIFRVNSSGVVQQHYTSDRRATSSGSSYVDAKTEYYRW